MFRYLDSLFFKIVKWRINKLYGYCSESPSEYAFMSSGNCAGCDASRVQDWIDGHIELNEWISDNSN